MFTVIQRTNGVETDACGGTAAGASNKSGQQSGWSRSRSSFRERDAGGIRRRTSGEPGDCVVPFRGDTARNQL